MNDGSVCGRVLHAKGLCALHLTRLRTGRPAMGAPIASWAKPDPDLCKQPDCGYPAYSRGLCSAHYQRLIDGRQVDAPIRRVGRTLEDKVRYRLARAIPVGGCLIAHFIGVTGYSPAMKGDNGEHIASGHRAVYQVIKGPIPKWAQVHHACGVRACINPEHLVLASQKANMAEMHGRSEFKRRIAYLEAQLADHHCSGCTCTS